MTSRLYREVELELLEYFSLLPEMAGPCVTIGAGTDYELTVPVKLLLTLDQVLGKAAMPKNAVAEAYQKQAADRLRQAEETMAMFDDEEDRNE